MVDISVMSYSMDPLIVVLLYLMTVLGASLSMHAGASASWPRIYIVRVIDYVHYPEEKVVYLARFILVVCSVWHAHGWMELFRFAGFVGVATAQVCFQEFLLHWLRVRTMERRLLRQGFVEGGIYFGSPFGLTLLRSSLGARRLYIMTVLASTYSCLLRGWPTRAASRSYSRRELLASLAPRAIQLTFGICVLAVKRNTCHRNFAAAMATVQLPGLCIFFVGYRLLGRSYSELGDGRKPPLLIDASVTAFRILEPLVGALSAVCVAVSLLGYC